MVHAAGSFFGQGWLQVGELVLAFLLSALIGLERQLRGKPAGLRTQSIVGTASALFLLVSKYGFSDVLGEHVTLDPSRVAAQVVSGIGFLGAGLILTRRGAVRGLTTAAAVWETAAVGMAAGAGLWLLALVVTALHFVIIFGLSPLAHRLPGSQDTQVHVEVTYADGRGLLRDVLHSITSSGWTISRASPMHGENGMAILQLQLNGAPDAEHLVSTVTGIDGVHDVQLLTEDDVD